MSWFGGVFLVALVLALATGRAYFRGFAERSEEPRRYWSIVGCYAALAAFSLAVAWLK
ncbi:MAG: hypothetical protein MUC55_01265 [Burkholderiales bacterium]|jgi:hypothetical protein|nr:hypothetical protein [Burkholderiales bacterium]